MFQEGRKLPSALQMLVSLHGKAGTVEHHDRLHPMVPQQMHPFHAERHISVRPQKGELVHEIHGCTHGPGTVASKQRLYDIGKSGTGVELSYDMIKPHGSRARINTTHKRHT